MNQIASPQSVALGAALAEQQRFTLLCLSGQSDSAALEAARALSATGIDWEGWSDQLVGDAVAPLMYHVLRNREMVPPEVEERLRSVYLRSAWTSVLRDVELGEVLARLDAAGVDAMVLKGAALAITVYDDPALRPMVDLDLLVHPQDRLPAMRALEAAGFLAAISEPRPGLTMAHESQILMRKEGHPGAMLELHWHLLDSPYHQERVPMDWFWQTSRRVTFQARGSRLCSGRVMGPEAQLLHLCAHLSLHHEGNGLLWQHDIAEILRRQAATLDWDLLLQKAREFGLVLPLKETLGNVIEGWCLSVPAGVTERLRAAIPSDEEARAFQNIAESGGSVGRRFVTDLAGIAGWRAKSRFALANIFPSTGYMRRRYRIRHPLLVPLYYPYRWYLGLSSTLRGRRRQP